MKGEDGELVVLEGEEADGDEVLEPPPPPNPWFTAPRVVAKKLEKDSAVSRKSAAVPWYAQILEQGSGPDERILFVPSNGHYTLQWVMRRLF